MSKIINTAPKVIGKKALKVKNELEDPLVYWEIVKSAFKEWADKPSVNNQSEYDWYVPPKDMILVRVFHFIPDDKYFDDDTSIVDGEGKNLSKERFNKLLPFCKVIKVGQMSEQDSEFKDLKKGEVILLSDQYAGAKKNEAFDEWVEKYKNERPVRVEAPPKYIGNISKLTPFLFIGDKFKEGLSTDDAFTFTLPTRMFSGFYKK